MARRLRPPFGKGPGICAPGPPDRREPEMIGAFFLFSAEQFTLDSFRGLLLILFLPGVVKLHLFHVRGETQHENLPCGLTCPDMLAAFAAFDGFPAMRHNPVFIPDRDAHQRAVAASDRFACPRAGFDCLLRLHGQNGTSSSGLYDCSGGGAGTGSTGGCASCRE